MSNATQAFVFKHHLCGFMKYIWSRKLQREVKGTLLDTVFFISTTVL